MTRKTKYIISLLAAVVIVGCSETPDIGYDGDADDGMVSVGFTMSGTRAGSASSTTYRALLDSADFRKRDGSYPYLGISGTYRGPNTDERDWLTACEVNGTTGEWVSDTHKYGLRAYRGYYRITFVSPAVAPQEYQTGWYNKWGFLLHRELQENEPELYISKPYKIRLAGNHLEDSMVYDVPDTVLLKDHRAKLTFILKCGKDIASATVSRITMKNIYESAYYNIGLDTLDNFTLAATEVPIYEPSEPLTVERDGDSITVCEDFFLFPLAYSSKDDKDQYVYSIPTLEVYLGRGAAEKLILQNLLPQHSYKYVLTINSAYVNIDVQDAPWDEHSGTGLDDDIDKTPTMKNEGIDPQDWDDTEKKDSID